MATGPEALAALAARVGSTHDAVTVPTVAGAALFPGSLMTARLAPLLAVAEILLGVLIGPGTLGWAWDSAALDVLAHAGLAVLLFLSGHRTATAAGRRGVGASGPVPGSSTYANPTRHRERAADWVTSLALGVGAGLLLSGALGATSATSTTVAEGAYLGVALAARPGAAGEAGTVIALALLAAVRPPAAVAGSLVAIAVLTAGAAAWVGRREPVRFLSPQAAARLVVPLLAALVWLGQVLGPAMLLAAYAAGLAVRELSVPVAEEAEDAARDEPVRTVVEAVGEGLLIPVFYVTAGMTLGLVARSARPWAFALAALGFLGLLLVVGGLLAALPSPGACRQQWLAQGTAGPAALPLVVIVVSYAMGADRMPAGQAAALITGAMVRALLAPLIIRRRNRAAVAERSPCGAGRPLR